jgi:membrane associated rhomboid family serine protease
MFVPVWDENPLRSIPFQFVTLTLIAVNVAVFLLEASGMSQQAIASFAIVPHELFQVRVLGGPAPLSGDAIAVPERYTLISYMFFHGDILHLASNMVFLWVFGDNIEDDLGHVRFLVFYLLCGIVAGLTHAWLAPDSKVPLIGASGAVAGVVAAYIILHPRVRVWVLALKFLPLRLNAMFVLGLWIAIQVVMIMMPHTDGVAWWAHVGGLVAGAVLVVIMRRPGVVLFDKGLGST